LQCTNLTVENKRDDQTRVASDCWRFINNRRADAEYLNSLDSVTNQGDRETLWKNYLSESDQWEEECLRIINSERARRYSKKCWTTLDDNISLR
jgi:hypothetical protein